MAHPISSAKLACVMRLAVLRIDPDQARHINRSLGSLNWAGALTWLKRRRGFRPISVYVSWACLAPLIGRLWRHGHYGRCSHLGVLKRLEHCKTR
jgi:hypothetical protein